MDTFDKALGELRGGRKRSHWMWFIFPQLRGLGRSPTALKYGIGSLAEAKAYLCHPLLGRRLEQCRQAVLDIRDKSLTEVFGVPDDIKFVSSMTLFATASGGQGGAYQRALDQFAVQPDRLTLALIAGAASQPS